MIELTKENLKCFGVYLININGHKYVGSTTVSFRRRWHNHKMLLRQNKHSNRYLQNAYNKYGESCVAYSILEIITNRDNVSAAEQRHADQIRPECNLRIITQSNLGYKHTPETILLMKQRLTGLKRSPESIENIKKAQTGKQISEVTKERIRKAMVGRVFTTEHKSRLSAAEQGHKNHMYGKRASQETRNKMVESQPKGKDHALSRRVLQISCESGEVIRQWNSMGDIRREIGIKHCMISDCCRGKQKTAGGYRWEYDVNLNRRATFR